jgi:hypothetical protein
MRRGGAALLRQASGRGACCSGAPSGAASASAAATSAQRAFAAQAAPAAAPAAAAKLEALREKLAAGPDFNAFISGGTLASKDGYSVTAPPLKARVLALRCARARARARACARAPLRRRPCGGCVRAAQRAARSARAPAAPERSYRRSLHVAPLAQP